MVNIDMNQGITTFGPPALVAGEVGARVAGLTINEWFYVVAIFCMLTSTVVSSIKALRPAPVVVV